VNIEWPPVNQNPCPTCGRCPTCGHAPANPFWPYSPTSPYIPAYPVQPQEAWPSPWWQIPPVTCDSTMRGL
jgi:hypothetical protein